MARRLVFFPLPLQGHINPLFQLADIFYSKGFSICIICTRFNAPNPANHPHFTFHTIDDGLSEEDASMKDVIALTIKLNETCAPDLRAYLSGLLLGDPNQERVVCLITDAMCYSSQAVADSLNLQRIALRTSSITAYASSLSYPLITEKGYLDMQDTEAMVPELPPLKIKDIPRVKTESGLYSELLSHMVKATKLSSGLIFNSFEELETHSLTTVYQDLRIPIYPIGPFHKLAPSSSTTSLLPEERSSISWLDNQPPNSVLYASFGSLATFDEPDFTEIAYGLANSGHRFLWVVRGSKNPFPDGFSESAARRGHVVGWAPQKEVLAHQAVGGFLTHNGWNSTLESVCEGVPMVCLPRFSDQTINARYVSDVWRIGVNLEGRVERGSIEGAIRRLMVDKEGNEMRDRISALRKKAIECLGEEGSSSKSLAALVDRIRSF